MKKATLIMSIASSLLILASIMMIGISFGWFANVLNLNDGIISVGDLRYSETGAFITDDQVLQPGEELLDTAITLTNTSPIDSQMRVKISYTKITRPVDVLVIETVDYADSDDHLAVVFDSTFVFSSGYWYYNATDAVISANSGLIEIISSIYYDGDLTGIDYSGQTIEVTITIEVKQNDNVTWSELTSYDFSTGYPA